MLREREIKLGEEFSRREQIYSFLDKYFDFNPIHRIEIEDKDHPDYLPPIMPGMYYLNLASKLIKKPILHIDVNFLDIGTYEVPLHMLYGEDNNNSTFSFFRSEDVKKERPLFKALITYNSKEVDETSNQEKLDLVFRIPGILQLEDSIRRTGIPLNETNYPAYVSQSISFNGVKINSPTLDIQYSHQTSDGKYSLQTNFHDYDGNLISPGSATVALHNKNIIAFRRRMLRPPKKRK